MVFEATGDPGKKTEMHSSFKQETPNWKGPFTFTVLGKNGLN